MARFKFTCHKCDSHRLEEVMFDVTVISEIAVLDDDGLEYGEQTNEDGVVDRYQCCNCGQSVAVDEKALFKSLELSPVKEPVKQPVKQPVKEP